MLTLILYPISLITLPLLKGALLIKGLIKIFCTPLLYAISFYPCCIRIRIPRCFDFEILEQEMRYNIGMKELIMKVENGEISIEQFAALLAAMTEVN